MDWRASAACLRAHDPDIFFPVGRNDPAQLEAIAICGRCRVRERCLDWAIQHEVTHGVWGGLSEEQRELIARGDRQTTMQAS
jgi:WhiB family redox-sensing transcriptional regulator